MSPKKLKRGRPRATQVNETTSIVYLKCNHCGQTRKINTTSPEKYTDEVRKNYKCLFCRYK